MIQFELELGLAFLAISLENTLIAWLNREL
jgi:hypothetical protein